jgi:hypothetical protein
MDGGPVIAAGAAEAAGLADAEGFADLGVGGGGLVVAVDAEGEPGTEVGGIEGDGKGGAGGGGVEVHVNLAAGGHEGGLVGHEFEEALAYGDAGGSVVGGIHIF